MNQRYSHSPSSYSRTSSSSDRCSPVRNERNDSSVGAGNHEDTDVSPANPRYSSEQDIADSDEDEACDDVLIYQLGLTIFPIPH